MRIGAIISKSLGSVVFFCTALGVTLYGSHTLIHYLVSNLSVSDGRKVMALVFTVVAPLLAIFIIHRKERLRDVNFIWILIMTTVSTIALFILWDFMVTAMRRS